ncbi:hypothetical protein F441_06415 [Phytophthora nicotianae CJ01A1]|uniref:Uncharacterized protein n=4 Tax=Phytophthora nicotianae TaxID=4792 RepID=V9FHL5_PHYNI|nr:hypothetical protein F443_06408 [Phytophthora nicotianae P1569]ETK89770.1 hypothetical protein L915_06293 [Phytophthora nicotianae]ETP19655.1 hypothetical protein F441_06415 [Phytophthora nicotianae CJ01A1]ETP47595.1 hypothetical protein F442_06452 [Phytophthora nicotianae P10297]ETL43205.1 hypothetical protein L916_06228 [Phytophthora nicotianae]
MGFIQPASAGWHSHANPEEPFMRTIFNLAA